MPKSDRVPPRRILALDPMGRGFGFVVFEGASRPVDWGVTQAPEDVDGGFLRRLTSLLARYRPDALVLEDWQVPGCRRRARARRLLAAAYGLATTRDISVRCVSRRSVEAAFRPDGARTKQEIAATLARRYPEVASRLPPPRKPWMSEDRRMSLFDAAALAHAFFTDLPSDRRRAARRGRPGAARP